MVSLIVDPFVLATPDIGDGRQSIQRYVQDLLDWSTLLEEDWISVLITERAAECLQADDCYPLYPSLATAFKLCDIQEFDVNTVTSVANSLLQRTPSLEQRFGVADILVDPPLTVIPDVPGTRKLATVGEELSRCLGMVALLVQHQPDRVPNQRLATRDSNCPDRHLQVSGTIIHGEVSQDGPMSELRWPVQISGNVRLCETLDDLLHSLQPTKIWSTGPSRESVTLAIRLEVLVVAQRLSMDRSWEDTADAFEIGCEFLDNLAEYSFDHDPPKIKRLLRACAETVLGTNMSAVHALRRGDGPNEPQRRRDSDKAWRRDIDRDFHLHYWERPGQGPEFGCIGPHNSFWIPLCR